MKHFRYFFAFLMVFILACGTSATGLNATVTATFGPTATILPTKSPTPEPTATPNKLATAIAEATEVAENAYRELDNILEDSNIPYQDGYLAWQYDEPIKVGLTGPEQRLQGIDENLIGRNFVLKSDVTWTATGIIVCGVIFRSEPDLSAGEQYQFAFLRLSGLPAWAIDVSEFGSFKNSITKTQFSSALLQGNGATNQFVLVAQENEFTLYINRVRQGRFFDNSKQRDDGSFAFFAVQDSGKGECEFTNSWIWSLDPPPPGGGVIGSH